MIPPHLADVSALTLLRLLAWANAAFAAALLAGVVIWLAGCGLESRTHVIRG